MTAAERFLLQYIVNHCKIRESGSIAVDFIEVMRHRSCKYDAEQLLDAIVCLISRGMFVEVGNSAYFFLIKIPEIRGELYD